MKTFKKGGIHPNPNKLTADVPVTSIPRPDCYIIPISQSIGAPPTCVVKAGQHVTANELLASAEAFVSAPIHSPVSGIVKKIEKTRTPQGLWQQAIILQPDPEELLHDSSYNPVDTEKSIDVMQFSSEEIIKAVGDMGVVGLGGATFPTRVKLSIPQGKKADFVIVNGAECEPYLTCDDRLMREQADKIITGTRLLMRAAKAPKAIIGIEANKKEAIGIMSHAASAFADIEICPLRTRYPQGGEKQLIQALTGRTVPAGGLPIDVGCIVDNVATAAAVTDAVCGVPLTRRVVTVTGPDVANPGNYIVETGMPIAHILQCAGNIPEHTGKIIAGGPMMGRAISHLDAPATKGLSGLLLFPESMSRRAEAGACIRCARCVQACPMGLEPYLLQLYALNGRYADGAAHGVMNCIECGCCSWSCPSARPLLDYIRLTKTELRKKK